NLLNLIWNGPIRARPYIKEEVAIFAYHVHQFMHDEFRRLERVILDVTPGLVADGGVSLPRLRTDAGQLPSFNIEDTGIFRHRKILIRDNTYGSTTLCG